MFDYAISDALQSRGIDAVAVTKERLDLSGEEDVRVLRGATAERRVLVTNNVRDFAPLIQDLGLRGEQHYGVLFTDDDTFPRSEAGVGLLVRSLEAFAGGKQDDWLVDGAMYLHSV